MPSPDRRDPLATLLHPLLGIALGAWMLRLVRIPCLALLVALGSVESRALQAPNVLLVIADDLGVDLVGAYGEHPVPAQTPVLDGLAEEGLLFRTCWANPGCSPTRATLLTGRYAHRTGIGTAFPYGGSQQELSPAEATLPDRLPAAYTSAAIGKWHLANAEQSGAVHPLLCGFDQHLGPIHNVGGSTGGGYFDYVKHVNGVPQQNTAYATTEQVDDALAFIEGAEGPWFLWLAFSAPHSPFHDPPAALHDEEVTVPVSQDVPDAVRAAVQAMDTELGRLLDALDPATLANTHVIVVGDNGTASPATLPPFDPDHAKGTVYEGGVRVPLIMSGPGVPVGRECEALVNTTDLYATVLELAGGTTQGPTMGQDAVSLVPYLADPDQPSLRASVYTESFFPNGVGPGPFIQRQRAVRDGRFTLLEIWEDPTGPPRQEFYDLAADPMQTDDMLGSGVNITGPALLSLLDLRDELVALDDHDPWPSVGSGLGGALGAPVFVGTGEAEAGGAVRLLLWRANPGVPAVLVVGLQAGNQPFYGGTLIPTMDWLVVTNSGIAGMHMETLPWPDFFPVTVPMWWQMWVLDPTGPQGLTSTNGLLLVP